VRGGEGEEGWEMRALRV
jgi:hypothetical protein